MYTGPLRTIKRLSEKQIHILSLMVDGKTRKDIAHAFGNSVKTIDNDIAGTENPNSIEKILCLQGTAALVRFALENGIVPSKRSAVPDFVNSSPGVVIKTTGDLAQALFRAAEQAADGKCNPLQVGSLCDVTRALIELASFQMQADKTIEWLKDKQ